MSELLKLAEQRELLIEAFEACFGTPIGHHADGIRFMRMLDVGAYESAASLRARASTPNEKG